MQVEGTEHLVSLQIFFIPSRGGPTLKKKGRLHGVPWLSKTPVFGLLATIVMRYCNAWKKQVSVVILAKSRTSTLRAMLITLLRAQFQQCATLESLIIVYNHN
jgi:hypothetical protein